MTDRRQARPSGYRWDLVSAGEPLSRTEVERSEARPDEALVRVAGCGLCHTDLGFHAGDVVAAVLFLLSEEAAHITGQVLVVDGGQTA